MPSGAQASPVMRQVAVMPHPLQPALARTHGVFSDKASPYRETKSRRLSVSNKTSEPAGTDALLALLSRHTN